MLVPSSGPPGADVQVQGSGFGALEAVHLSFIDSAAGTTKLANVLTDPTGSFTAQVKVPLTATAGNQKIRATARGSRQKAKPTFNVM